MDISAVMEQFPGETRTEDFKAALETMGAENMGALAKGIVELRTQALAQNETMTGQISELKTELEGRVKIPGESATPEEKAAFNKAIGVPESVTGYEIEGDESMLQSLLKAGVPVGAAKAYHASLTEANKAAFQEAVGKLGERGDELVVKGLESAFPGEENAKVREQLSINPVLAPLFHQLGKATVENPMQMPNVVRAVAEKRPYPSMDKAGMN